MKMKHRSAKTLERSIATIQHELENQTAVEIELKRRLDQLADHLIQKQAQEEIISLRRVCSHVDLVSVGIMELEVFNSLVYFGNADSRAVALYMVVSTAAKVVHIGQS